MKSRKTIEPHNIHTSNSINQSSEENKLVNKQPNVLIDESIEPTEIEPTEPTEPTPKLHT